MSGEVATGREDHRVRIAREKRTRTRAQLLRSVMAVCSGDLAEGPKVIDDVVRHAGVSRGTFYKHFASLEEAVAQLGADLAEEMTLGIAAVHDPLTDPRERVAMGFQLFLRRAILDPHWGGFIAHVQLPDRDNAMVRHMVADLRAGIAQGHFALADPVEGLDLLVGTKIEAIRRVIRGERGGEHARAIAALILRGLGVPSADATAIASAMAHRLDAEGPLHLDWWPAPEAMPRPATAAILGTSGVPPSG